MQRAIGIGGIIDQVGEMEDTEFGKFVWIIDPEKKVELWEPKPE